MKQQEKVATTLNDILVYSLDCIYSICYSIVTLNIMKTCLIHACVHIICIVYVPNLCRGSLTDANCCIVIIFLVVLLGLL